MSTAHSSSRHRAARQRRLILIDIENVGGGPLLDRRVVARASREIVQAVKPRPGDQVILGVSHAGLLEAAHHWPSIRYVVRSGRNGADLALLEVLDENVSSRFKEVVLVSGDGIFATVIAELALHGTTSTVVAHAKSLSHQLKLAAGAVRYFPASPGSSPASKTAA